MKRATIYAGALALLMIIMFFLIRSNDSNHISNKENSSDIEREMKSVTFREIYFDENSKVNDLYRPVILQSDESSFYAIDFSDMVIYRFDFEGELINTIGNGKGRGPGEILLAPDFFVDDNDIWVVDSNQLLVQRFKKNGEFIDSRNIKGHPLRIIAQDNKLSLLVFGGREGLFRSIPKDLDSESISKFGVVIEDQAKNIMSLGGTLQSREDKGFIYVPSYASSIYFYDNLDSLSFIANAPDNQSFIPSEDKSTSERMMIMAPDPDIQRKRSLVSGGMLYVYVTHRISEGSANNEEETKELFLDVFDLENGEYHYSFTPPELLTDFTIVGGDTLIVIADSKIKMYKFSIN